MKHFRQLLQVRLWLSVCLIALTATITIGYPASAAGKKAAATAQTTVTATTASTTEKKHDYVLNSNTKKYHYPDCSSVSQMKKKNRVDVNDTKSNIEKQGYVACKKCKP